MLFCGPAHPVFRSMRPERLTTADGTLPIGDARENVEQPGLRMSNPLPLRIAQLTPLDPHRPLSVSTRASMNRPAAHRLGILNVDPA